MEITEHQTISKRKRSKRIRPSPSSPSSSSARESNLDSPVYSSAATSSELYASADREDEDMANCLILLARGDSQSPETKGETKRQEYKSGGGRVGIYMYECKTCGRTFPSFQALGGHRASHKKPKLALVSDLKKSAPARDPGDERKSISSEVAVAPHISKQLVNKGSSIEKKMRTHECSICASEFGSGQALGGHMRKHRAASNNSNTGKSSNDCESSLDEIGGMARTADFDLNLPETPEEEEDHGGYAFDRRFPSIQRPGLVFSALVGCHY